ncbi:MAG: hypothetical protein FWF19_02025 [Euryarchaeota archaeon]|nr:hypothetical protein [Euryarchaeota archaeon]
MKLHIILTVSLFFFICVAGGSSADDSLPLMPAEFYGTVSIDNSPAPVGTIVAALLNGVLIDEFIITETGVFGGKGIFDKRLSVVVEGAGPHIIQFQVNGISIEGMEEFAPGTSKKVDLFVTSGTERSTPIPTAVIIVPPTQIEVQPILTADPFDSYNSFIPYDPYYPEQPQTYDGFQDQRVFTSGDERAQLICYPGCEMRTAAGSTVQQATITHKSLTSIQTPQGLTYAGYGYELIPANLSFLPDATLIIHIDDELFDVHPMIMHYDTERGIWTHMPFLADRFTGTIRAAITESGIYGVVIQEMTPATVVTQAPVPPPTAIETIIPTAAATTAPIQTKMIAPVPRPSEQSKAMWYIAGGILFLIIVNMIVWGVYRHSKKERKKDEEL